MASILDRYGIKEVADITFYELGESGLPTYPVLYIDTAKTSTIEQTAEQTDARGGKGNPILISWDFNKEINVTLEDALFSVKSMAIMFGNGTAKAYTGDSAYIMKTEQFTATSSAAPSGSGPAGFGSSSMYCMLSMQLAISWLQTSEEKLFSPQRMRSFPRLELML